jgi:hypothetical protein
VSPGTAFSGMLTKFGLASICGYQVGAFLGLRMGDARVCVCVCVFVCVCVCVCVCLKSPLAGLVDFVVNLDLGGWNFFQRPFGGVLWVWAGLLRAGCRDPGARRGALLIRGQKAGAGRGWNRGGRLAPCRLTQRSLGFNQRGACRCRQAALQRPVPAHIYIPQSRAPAPHSHPHPRWSFGATHGPKSYCFPTTYILHDCHAQKSLIPTRYFTVNSPSGTLPLRSPSTPLNLADRVGCEPCPALAPHVRD